MKLNNLARKIYNKLLLKRFLPEIEAIKKGKVKAIKGKKEIDEFFDKLLNDMGDKGEEKEG